MGLVPDVGDAQGVASSGDSLEVEGAVLGGDGTRLELAVPLEELTLAPRSASLFSSRIRPVIVYNES